jgi:hypothetical protein
MKFNIFDSKLDLSNKFKIIHKLAINGYQMFEDGI